jgi:type I restriction enzyme, S subunit
VVRKQDQGSVYPVYGGGGATFFVDKFNRQDCVIVARFGMSEACVRYVSGQFFLNDSGLSVQTNTPQELSQQFLDLGLLAKQTEIYSLGRGTAQKNLDVDAFRSMLIPVPPLEDQKRIVAILDEAFEGLSRARANAEANLAEARELFEAARESYFAKKPSSVWRLAQLSELVSIKHGFAFKSEYFSDQGAFAVLTPGNFFEHGGFRARGDKQRYYTGDFPKEFLLRPGDLLVAMTEQAPGLLGSCIIVPDEGKYLHNQRLGLIQPLTGTIWNAKFFAHAFNLVGLRRGLSDTCSGATVRHTSPGRILAQVIPYCEDGDELERAAVEMDMAEAHWAKLSTVYQAQVSDLEALRKSLIQKAFSGELT